MAPRFDRRSLLAALVGLAASPSLTASASSASSAQTLWPTDGWEIGKPERQEMEPELLALVDQQLQINAPLLSGIVAVRGGKIIFERSFNGYDPDQPIHIWSCSKSVTNIAVGAAVLEGLIPDLDLALGDLIADRIPAGVDQRVYGITLRNLLTMQAGWAWDSTVNFAHTAETDDLDLMFTRPMQCNPGTYFEYDSGCSNILSYVVQTVAGETMAEYLQPRLFDPLGIATPKWIVTDDGANRGGGGLFLTPRQMAKIGYLYLHEGRWDDVRIVGRNWVRHSTTEQSSGNSYLRGTNIGGGPYGYQWWVAEAAGHAAFTALGYGGQMIYVVPDLDLVVATAYADADATRPDLQQHPRPAIEELIVPAAV